MKGWMGVVLAGVMMMGSGCAGKYGGMAKMSELPEFAMLARQADATRETRVETHAANGAAVKLAVYESGPGNRERVYVMIHGVASDSRAWRFMRGGMAGEDVLMVDMPGCGKSDAPSAAAFGREGYSPNTMARCVMEAVAARLAVRGKPGKITLVGHSLGGMSILRIYGHGDIREKYCSVLERVDSIVLFAPGDVAITEMPAGLRRMADVQDFEVGMANCLGMVKGLAAAGECEAVVAGDRALKEEADRMRAMMLDEGRRHAMQAMLNHAVAGEKGLIDWEEAEMWRERYKEVKVPCLLVWGERDPYLPVAIGYKLVAELPDARLRVLQPAKHCLAMEQPRVCAELVREFAAGEGGRGGRVAYVEVAAPERVGRMVGASYAESARR